jgi:hypothetical protein
MEFPMPVTPKPKYTWKARLRCRLFGHPMPLAALYDAWDPLVLHVCKRCGRCVR